MKNFVFLLTLALAALSINVAYAHGTVKPEHGGIIKLVGETTFELVVKSNSVELYVVDDEELLLSAGLNAKLLITSGTEKSEVILKPAGSNKFDAQGIKLASGAKVGVLVTLANKRKLGANFVLK